MQKLWLLLLLLAFPAWAEVDQEPGLSAKGAQKNRTIVSAVNTSALAVGPNGYRNPTLQVDTTAANAVTGVKVTAAATGGTTTLGAIDPAANSSFTVASLGSGAMNVNSPGGNVNLQSFSITQESIQNFGIVFTPSASFSGATTHFLYTGSNDITQTASAESKDVFFNLSNGSKQHNTGALSLQREFVITGVTEGFVGASTMTDAATFGYSLPGCGTNATCTNLSGILHQSTALTATGTITNSYAINVAADTGATNNFAERISGYRLEAGTGDTIAAGAGAGGSPTIAIAGPPGDGTITLTTGTLPSAASTVATITYGVTFPTGSVVLLTPASNNAAGLSGVTMVFAVGATTNFTITSGGTGLTPATQYIWNYHIAGY